MLKTFKFEIYVKQVYNSYEKGKKDIMFKEFDKRILMNNINFLIDKNNIKIGELENNIGVSTGYISRLSKEDGTKPGIDFIVNIARELKMSLDTLLYIDLSKATPTEIYLSKFLEKLIKDTANDKLEWSVEKKEVLDNIITDFNGNIDHILFEQDDFGKIYFPSHLFGYNTLIKDNCYNLRLKNGNRIFLMNIDEITNQSKTPIIEIWAESFNHIRYICNNIDKSVLSEYVEPLYNNITESLTHPKIDESLRRSIDAFMEDDLEDDIVEYDNNRIPF